MKIKSFLLENLGIRQTILKNTFWLAVAEIVTGFLRLLLLIYVARILGAREYGTFTFAFSFISVAVLFSDLGIIDIITREFSRDKEKEKDLPSLIGLEIILTAGTLALMVAGSFLITSDPHIQRLIWILALFILLSSFFSIFLALLRGRQKMEYEAGFKIIHAVILAGFSFIGIIYFPSAMALGYSYLAANIFSLIALLIFFHFRFQRLRLHFDRSIFRILKISWPLSLGYVPMWIYITISSIILGYFNLLTENGWYSAASKIALIAMIPAGLIIKSFYPVLSNFFVHSKEKFQKSWDYLMSLIIFFIIPMAVGGITLAPKIIYFFYGSGFTPSIFSFQLFIIVVAITFINYPYSVVLIVSDHQKKNFFLMIMGMLINILLSIILIPLYGSYGAIISVIIPSFIVLFFTIIISRKLIEISLFNVKLLKCSIVSGLFGYAMFSVIRLPFVYNLNIFYSASAGVLTYCMLCFLFYKIYKSSTIFTKLF